MRLNKTRFHCAYNFGQQGYELFLEVLDPYDRTRRFATSINVEPVEDNSSVDPLLVLPENQAQKLIDALWAGGLRPTEGHGSAGQLGATEKHLNDMRNIVFDQLCVKSPWYTVLEQGGPK